MASPGLPKSSVLPRAPRGILGSGSLPRQYPQRGLAMGFLQAVSRDGWLLVAPVTLMSPTLWFGRLRIVWFWSQAQCMQRMY